MRRKLAVIALAGLTMSGLASVARADEIFIPKGFLYRPGDTRLPPTNSRRYRIITEADRRESEIYASRKVQAEFESYLVNRYERNQSGPRQGWRRY